MYSPVVAEFQQPALDEKLSNMSIESMEAAFAQNRWTLRFRCAHVEAAYKAHHLASHAPHMRFVCKLFFVFTTGCTAAAAFEWRWFPLYEFFGCHPSQVECGITIGTFIPLTGLSLVMAVLHSSWLTPSSYQRVLALSCVLFVYVFTDIG